jgi:hypothetical protein
VTDDDSGGLDDVVPKLTIGQRILTALPNLQREPTPAAPARTPPPTRAARGTRPDGRRDGADAVTATEEPDGAGVGDDDSPDEIVADGTPAGRGARLRDSLLKPSPSGARQRPGEDLDSMTREEITHRIKKLDDRERFLALTSVPIGIVVGVVLTAFAIHLNPPLKIHDKLNPKHVSDSLILLEGGARVLLSGIVVAAALSRRRSFVGFALLFLGTSMGSPLFALPFWVLGGYLIWRVFKYQRVLTARSGSARGARTRRAPARDVPQARAPGGKRVPANPREAGRTGAAAARARAQSSRRRGRKEPAPTGPTPSKRYTPPRPTRPRPPAPPS